MRFLADMGVSTRVTAWLRDCGHDALHVQDLHEERLPDMRIFAMAETAGRIVLTFDLDFGEILALSSGKTVSVILFRLNDTTTSTVIGRLRKVLDDCEDALEAGAIVVVEDSRHRVRRLPIGE